VSLTDLLHNLNGHGVDLTHLLHPTAGVSGNFVFI
jgi:hypothetical protein